MIAQRLIARLPSSAVRTSALSSRLGLAQQPAALPRIAHFSSSVMRKSDGHQPIIQGEGSRVGQVANDEQQATGLERYELLGKLQGVEVFDMEPLKMDRPGTTENPIKVMSMVSRDASIAGTGCAGTQQDEDAGHSLLWKGRPGCSETEWPRLSRSMSLSSRRFLRWDNH